LDRLVALALVLLAIIVREPVKVMEY